MGGFSLTIPAHIAQVSRPRYLRYSFTVIVLGAVLGLNLFFNTALSLQGHLLLYVIAIILSSWYGGIVCGILATILSFVASVYTTQITSTLSSFISFRPPTRTAFFYAAGAYLQSIIFLTEGIMISLLIHLMQKVRIEAVRNERHYRDLAESIPQIVWTAKPNGLIDYHNQRWDEYLGEESRISKITDLKDSIHPDDAREFESLWTNAEKQGEAFVFEHRLMDARDKIYHWHLTRIVPLFDDKFHVMQKWIGTSTDIDEQKRSEANQRFLLKASNILSSSLEYQATLTSVARLAVPHIADWCTIDILESDGGFEQIAVAHKNTGMNQLLANLHDSGFSLSSLSHARGYHYEHERPILVSRVTETLLHERIRNNSHLEMLLKAGIYSFMILPLVNQKRVIGTISLVSGSSKRQYTEADLLGVEELARRMALAIDNARLYQAAQDEIRERMLTEERMTHQANHDNLTGLPNRSFLSNQLNQAIKEARTKNGSFSLLFVDLDHFKNVNDTLGHPVGDTFLREISKRLQACVRQKDTVARFGGDEFIILLTDIKHEEDSETIARKVFKSLSEPFTHDGQDISIQASIGIAIYPSDGTDAHTLLKKADSALYQAKEKGRNIYQFYNQELEKTSTVRFNIENRIVKAFNQHEFFMEYQPVCTPDHTIVSAEALLRWEHPQLGRVSPTDFIPIAEDTGLIIPLEEWVLTTICKLQRGWQQKGLPAVPITMNISLKHLAHPDFVNTFARLVQEHSLDPKFIKVEITESAFMRNMEENIDKLEKLKQLGFSIALDDFGTGYSSLNHLKSFPIDILKIDRSFIDNCTSDPLDAAIVEAIIAMAHTLNLQVIAEGIETQRQLDYLFSLGCDYIQGNLFSLPISPDNLSAFIKNNQPKHSHAREHSH